MSLDPAPFRESRLIGGLALPAWPCADYVRTATIELTSRPRRVLLGATLRQLGCPIGISEETFVDRIVDRLRSGTRDALLNGDELRAQQDGDIEISFQDHMTVRGGMTASHLQIVFDLHCTPGTARAEREGGARCTVLLRNDSPVALLDFEHRCSSSQRDRFGSLLLAYATATGTILADIRSWAGEHEHPVLEGISLRTY